MEGAPPAEPAKDVVGSGVISERMGRADARAEQATEDAKSDGAPDPRGKPGITPHERATIAMQVLSLAAHAPVITADGLHMAPAEDDVTTRATAYMKWIDEQ